MLLFYIKRFINIYKLGEQAKVNIEIETNFEAFKLFLLKIK